MFVLALATTLLFGRIRTGAAWLLVPYLAWIGFAGVLTYQIDAAQSRTPKPLCRRRRATQII